mmetsp:Transcript_39371/g.59175  ORF Transcript_39371/g.59175 Transcript_39371/m.59175 type:complete len:211 (+) Transcript_39371:394-1026(+)
MRSKAIAEASFVAANGVGGLHTACIRPTSAIIGPRDTYCIELMLKDMKGTAIGFENAFIDSVYVLNVVLGHMLLEEKLNDPSTTKLVSGQSFNISNNEPMCFLDLIRRLKWATNGGFVYDKLPPPIVTAVATVVGFLMGIGKTPKGELGLLSPAVLDFMSAGYIFPSTKAERVLGYQPAFTMDEALMHAVDEHMALHPNTKLTECMSKRK